LVIYSDAVLTGAISLEPLESVTRWNTQILNSLRRIQNEWLTERLALNVAAPSRYTNSIEDTSGVRARE